MSFDVKSTTSEKFFGLSDEDVERWLFRFQQYCKAHSIPESSYTPLAATFLDGFACDWWRNRVEEMTPTHEASDIPWSQFKSEITRQFSNTDSVENSSYHLVILEQHSTVDEYAREYLRILMRLKPKPFMRDQIHFFIAGLKHPVKIIVTMQKPTSLDHAIDLAKSHDQAHDFYSNLYPSSRQDPQSNAPDISRLTPLTDQERNNLRQQGSCFRCRKPGHFARQCPKGLNKSGNGQTQQ